MDRTETAEAAADRVKLRTGQWCFEDFERFVNLAYGRGLTFRRNIDGTYEVRSPEGTRHTVRQSRCDEGCPAHQSTGMCSHRALVIHGTGAWVAWVPAYRDGSPVDWSALWKRWQRFTKAQDAGRIVVAVPDEKPARQRRRKHGSDAGFDADAVEADRAAEPVAGATQPAEPAESPPD